MHTVCNELRNAQAALPRVPGQLAHDAQEKLRSLVAHSC